MISVAVEPADEISPAAPGESPNNILDHDAGALDPFLLAPKSLYVTWPIRPIYTASRQQLEAPRAPAGFYESAARKTSAPFGGTVIAAAPDRPADALVRAMARPRTAGANSAAGRTQLIDATAIHCNSSSALNLANAKPRLRPLHLVVRETEFCGLRLEGDFRRRTRENGRNSVRRPRRCAISSPAELTRRDALPHWPSGAPSRLKCRLRVGVLRRAQTASRYSDKA